VLEKPKTQIQNFRTLSIFKERKWLSGLKPDVFFGVKKTASFSLAASSFCQPRDVSVAKHI
jgi:hypothetical protein